METIKTNYVKEFNERLYLYFGKPNTTSDDQLVIPMECVFDVLSSNHTHEGTTRGYKTISSKYHNITKREVQIFNNLCPTCITKPEKTDVYPDV